MKKIKTIAQILLVSVVLFAPMFTIAASEKPGETNIRPSGGWTDCSNCSQGMMICEWYDDCGVLMGDMLRPC